MKVFITALLIGIFLGAGGYWAWHGRYRPPVLTQSSPNEGQTGLSASNSDIQAKNGIKQIIDAKLEALELRAESIMEELRDTGQVVRRRARDFGAAVMDTATDMEITTAIKAKLATDPELSAWGISVNTSSRVVTLSGTVSSPEQIGRAMMLALETDNVAQVVSTIQVRDAAPD